MVILGLGTNLGNRLTNLRQALHLIKKIPHLSVSHISPIYISDALLPENAPAHWNNPYFNLALRCETQLTPLELLEQTKQIEKKLKIGPKEHWSPRIIDIDLLAWDDLILHDNTLHIPHKYLLERPFALWPLADIAPHWSYPVPGSMQGKTASELTTHWGSKFSGTAPLNTKQIPHRIDVPQWVGIINLTPDSFSTDGTLDDELGWQHIENLINTGADILDFGAEATGPNAIPLNADEEWKRLSPLLAKTLAEKNNLLIQPKISVDTRHAAVAEKALKLGVDWINDVSGLDDPTMRKIIRENECDIVFMHHLGIPVNKNHHLPLNKNPITFVYQWAEQRLIELEKWGIAPTRLIFDPGIGYGKTAEQSLEIIKNINVFHKLGVRLLVGHSRKSFLTQFTKQPAAKRDLETMLVSVHLATQSVDYLRVHNIEINIRGLRIAKELLRMFA